MGRKNRNKGFGKFLAWLVGLIVTLSVGFALTGETLTVPFLPGIVTVVTGWILIIAAVLTVIMAVFMKAFK